MSDQQKIAIVKVGGDVVIDEHQLAGLAANIRTLRNNHYAVVLLHGGGPQTTRLQESLGLVAKKIAGRRVTSEADLTIITQAIAGEVNVKLTSALIAAGLNAFGCHGASGRLIGAVKRPPRVYPGTNGEAVDFGEVGDVTTVNHALIKQLLTLDLIPIIATLGIGEDGRIYNINADTTVVALAKQLHADTLFLSTRIGGVFEDINDPSSRIKSITPNKARQLIENGVIVDGMIPKIEEAVGLLKSGVGKIAIISPEQNGAFQDILDGNGLHGTVISADLHTS